MEIVREMLTSRRHHMHMRYSVWHMYAWSINTLWDPIT
jgi:hypothetical protein